MFSAVADARRSFLEGSAYQSAPIEKTVEMSEIEFKSDLLKLFQRFNFLDLILKIQFLSLIDIKLNLNSYFTLYLCKSYPYNRWPSIFITYLSNIKPSNHISCKVYIPSWHNLMLLNESLYNTVKKGKIAQHRAGLTSHVTQFAPILSFLALEKISLQNWLDRVQDSCYNTVDS